MLHQAQPMLHYDLAFLSIRKRKVDKSGMRTITTNDNLVSSTASFKKAMTMTMTMMTKANPGLAKPAEIKQKKRKPS